MKPKKAIMFLMISLVAMLIMTAGPLRGETQHEEGLSWFRIHLGHGWGSQALTTEQALSFINKEVAPKFPQGMTISDSNRGEWRSPRNGLIREQTTVVDIMVANTVEIQASFKAITEAYLSRYKTSSNVSIYITRIDGVTADRSF